MPRLSGILETSLHADDLDRSRVFYERVFGFERYFAEARMVALGVPGGGVPLLFRRGGSTRPSPAPGGTAPAHDGSGTQRVCFAIPHAALDAWGRHFAACGVAIESRVSPLGSDLRRCRRRADGSLRDGVRRHQLVRPRPGRPFGRGRPAGLVAEPPSPRGPPRPRRRGGGRPPAGADRERGGDGAGPAGADGPRRGRGRP